MSAQTYAEPAYAEPPPQQPAPAPAPAAAPAAPAQPDYMEELQQLAALRDSGVLTQAEFDAKKAQILGL